MAKRYTTRKLQVFSLHAHIEGKAISDYKEIFSLLNKKKPAERVLDVNNKIVAIPVLEIIDDTYVYFIVYEGEKDVHPIIYDPEKAKARIEALVSGEIVATKTHGIIDFVHREALIEFNFRGAKAKDVASVIEFCLSSIPEYSKLNLELNPVVDETFTAAINQFERIRLANLKVVKSNPDWSDHYNHLSQVANDSEGQGIKVEITAARGGSLSVSKGIISYIKEFAQQRLSIFRSAKVIGVRTGEESETSISLENHIEHIKSNLTLTDKGHVDDLDIKHKLQDYRRARLKKSKNVKIN